jgi:hypothetical protein
MAYYWKSVRTWSYWSYALFSLEGGGKLLAALGVLYLFVEIADFFQVYKQDQYGHFGIFMLVALSVLWVLTTRRPVSRVRYKVPKKDLSFEVVIGDLFERPGELVISSNSTFDTDMSAGLIAPDSLQGQLAAKFFGGQTADIDRQIELSLKNEPFETNERRPGKKKEYPIGTVARVSAHGRNFYLVAMAHLNENGTAYSDVKMLDEALERLWPNMAKKAELGDMVIPAMGTGRGRVPLPRKKVIEKIAQSFAYASAENAFSNRLVIVVRPQDAEKFAINLFEVRDFLGMSLHI